MCKILVMPGVKTTEKEKLVAFIKGMGIEMSKGNDHGLGYAAFNNEGEMFSERWHRNNEAFEVRLSHGPITTEVIKSYQGLLSSEEKYSSTGVVDLPNLSSIILHTRFATTGRDFCNTHPFIKENSALIHNGMIHNHERFEKTVSSCDSESILTQYLKFNVKDDPKNIKKAMNDLTGYFACGVLSYMDDQPIVDVFKDNRANLGAAYIHEFHTTVFTTDVKDLIKVCGDVGLTVINQFDIKSNMMVRHHAITGNVVGVFEIEGVTKTYLPIGYHNEDFETTRWNGARHIPTTPQVKVVPKEEVSEWKSKIYDKKLGQWIEKIGL